MNTMSKSVFRRKAVTGITLTEIHEYMLTEFKSCALVPLVQYFRDLHDCYDVKLYINFAHEYEKAYANRDSVDSNVLSTLNMYRSEFGDSMTPVIIK